MAANWTIGVLVFVLSLYGALLSTYNFILARRDKRRRVAVSVSYAAVSLAGSAITALVIEARNPGFEPSTLRSVGFKLPEPDRRTVVLYPLSISTPLPHRLEAGSVCSTFYGLDRLVQALRENAFTGKLMLRGFYGDALGKEHVSKAVEVDVGG